MKQTKPRKSLETQAQDLARIISFTKLSARPRTHASHAAAATGETRILEPPSGPREPETNAADRVQQARQLLDERRGLRRQRP